MNPAAIKTHSYVYLVSPSRKSQKGFTLIELLIVIVILGILSGVLISVINPVRQQRKANQTVMRSNLEKLHMAQLACVNARLNPIDDCITADDLGVNVPTGEPTPATTYTIGSTATAVTVSANEHFATENCTMTYTYTVSSGIVTTSTNADCLVDF